MLKAEMFTELATRIASFDPGASDYAPRVVDYILEAARDYHASDVHLRPTNEGLYWQWRIDGVLQEVAMLPATGAANVVARLKVLAELLTYRNDLPQEGRIRAGTPAIEMRLSTFPTLHGEKAVVRLFAATRHLEQLDDLQLPAEITHTLRELLGETSGAVLITGPAGSGKTTTAYACLRHLAASGALRSLASLEDPIESELPAVSQSQVNLAAGFDMATGLRSLLRQDPEVLLVGEVRDRATAETLLQASLTGHLVLSTFHAGSAATAIHRLLDMAIEPYLLRSGIRAIVSQRLVRRLCQCAVPSVKPEDHLGLAVPRAMLARGCLECHGSGYRGRVPVAEMLVIDSPRVCRAILERADAPRLEALAVATGMITSFERARAAVAAGVTSPAELRRVFGFSIAVAEMPPASG
ncbi:MAG: GspE/PulE family protein [Pirellulales bacterium]|nr:GspE/PulE family protein [Pirellulales bacterium]